jgi:hypothetical protein
VGSIIGKRVNGRTYYYYAESRRVDGKPRVTGQRYLGTAEDVARLGAAAAEPEHARHLEFGRVAAVWGALRRLDLAGVVDRVVGRQRTEVSAGAHLQLAVLHRICGPERDLASWWQDTAAERFARPAVARGAFDPARFWRAARRLGPEERDAVEAAVADELAARIDPGGGPLPALVVDVPNFATSVPPESVDTATGVSLLVSRHGAVPLAARGYRCGERGSYCALAEQLAEQHRRRSAESEITLVFDAGQQAQLDLDRGLHFVGGLLPADHPDLLAHASSARAPVDPQRLPGVTALDTRAQVSGVSRRVLVTHSEGLHRAQLRGFTQALNHAARQLDGFAEALRSGAHRHTREQAASEIARITRVRWVDRVLQTSLTGSRPGELKLDWRIDDAARARLDAEFFGKQLLVTDRDEWSAAEVVTAYRARNHLDASFRRINEPAGEAWRRCSAEQIAVERLVSVLAVAVLHLMRQEADRAGLDLSVRELLEQLDGIAETALRYPSTGGRPRTRRLLTERTETQQRLFDLFGLGDLAPRPRK